VLNSVRATTTTVPDVTGLTEVQADHAIQAAGLTAIATYVNAPGLPGTVLNQNSPGGTIEPAGSPVQVTVTRGVFADD
jgi:beta-lactam-binding protein with PASTA domain